MNPKTVQFQYDINRMDAVNLVATIHIDDYDTRFLEVLLCERGGVFDVSGSTAAARFVTLAGELLNDSVPCTVEGNVVTVPVDAAAVKSQACTLKIEINLTKDGKVLTLPFPLFVRVRGSILDDAQITPESEGTIADLLKAAQEALGAAAAALEDAKDYAKLDNKPQINGHTLSGDKTSSELGLQDKLTAGENVTIDENGVISAEGGTDDYNALKNKPTINGGAISGDIQIPHAYLEYQGRGDGTHYLDISEENVFHNAVNGSFSFNHSDRSSSFCGLNPQSRWYPDEYPTDDNGILFRFINHYYDDSYTKTFVEPNYFFFSSVENAIYLRTDHYTYPDDVFVKGEWRKISGGSQIASGVVNQIGTISFYDADGNLLFTTTGASVIGPQGAPGQDYVLTAQDKTDIANIVLQELPTTEGVLYGNASN